MPTGGKEPTTENGETSKEENATAQSASSSVLVPTNAPQRTTSPGLPTQKVVDVDILPTVAKASPNPIPNEENYRPEYLTLENKIVQENETLNCLEILKIRLNQLEEGLLSREHASFLLINALPKILRAVLKHRYMDDDLPNRINKMLIWRVESLIIDNMTAPQALPLVNILNYIFDGNSSFYNSKYKREDSSQSDEGEIYASFPPVQKWQCSHLAVDNVNFFGRKGGFDAMLHHMRSDSPKCPLNVLALYFEALVSLQFYGYWVQTKQRYFIHEVKNILQPLLLNLSHEELKSVKKEDYETVMKHANQLFDAIFPTAQIGEFMEHLRLDVALKCFISRIFDKRLYGITYLSEIISNVRMWERSEHTGHISSYRESKYVNSTYLINWMVSNKLLETIFGPSAQLELLKKSTDVLALYARKNALTAEHIELIWNCGSIHEAFTSMVCKVLGDVAADLHASILSQIEKYLRAVPPGHFTNTYVTLVKDFARGAVDVESRQKFLDFLWEIATSDLVTGPAPTSPLITPTIVIHPESTDPTAPVAPTQAAAATTTAVSTGTSADLAQVALNHLMDLLKIYWNKSHRYVWAAKVIETLRKRVAVSFCYETLITIISSYPSKPSTSDSEIMVSIAERLAAEYNLIDEFFSELEHFKSAALKASQAPGVDISKLNETVLVGKLEYLTEVKTRLKFLSFLLNHYEEALPFRYYDSLWNCMIPSGITAQEKDHFFVWLMGALQPPSEGYVALDKENAVMLFCKKMMQMNPRDLSPMAFKCFVKYFVETNAAAHKLLVMPHVTTHEAPGSANANPGSNSNNSNSNNNNNAAAVNAANLPDEDFEVLTWELEGYNYLSKVVLEAAHPEVTRDAIEFFIKIHTKMSSATVERYGGKGKIRENFVQMCMSWLGTPQAEYLSAPAECERRVSRVTSLLVNFCEYSEVESGVKARSHGVSTRGRPITLHVTSCLPNAAPGETFVLECHSNQTLVDVKLKLYTKVQGYFQQQLQALQLQGPHAAKRDPSGAQRGLLTAEHLYFTSRRGIEIGGGEQDAKTLGELRIGSGHNLQLHSRWVLHKSQETFLRSRKRGGGASSSSKKSEKSQPNDAAERARSLIEIYHITQNAAYVALRKTEWDVNAAVMQLSDENFKNECVAEAAKTAQEEAMAASSGKTSRVDPDEIKRLPSYIITHNQEVFNQLFKLLSLPSEIITQRVWELLLRCPTSTALLDPLYAVDSSASPDWVTLFDVHSTYRMLYGLQIVDSILFPLVEDSTENSESDRVRWCKAFVARGGLTHLLSTLINVDWLGKSLRHSSDSSAPPPPQQKACMTLVLKICDFFLAALLTHQTRNGSQQEISAEHNLSDSFLNAVAKEIAPFVATILQATNLSHVISRVVTLVYQLSSPSTPASVHDQQGVAFAMRILTTIVTHNPVHFLPSFYAVPMGIPAFLQTALFHCTDAGIRIECCDSLYQIAHAVRLPGNTDPGLISPRALLLDWCWKNFPDHMETNPAVWRGCSEYFYLLERLVADAVGEQNATTAQQHHHTLIELVKKLKSRPIVQTRNSDADDTILIGIMDVISAMIKGNEKIQTELGREMRLVYELYYTCLFSVKEGPSAENLPKCKLLASRVAAFSLLVELCRNCTNNFMELLELLRPHHIGATQTKGVELSSDEDKSQSGYVGLKNLGNTCYINSLMQQFFMIPSLRYGFMMLDPEMQKSDSLAYQIEMIFANLQESEKPYYIPTGFTQAYKDFEGRPTNVHQQHDVDEFFSFLCQRLEQQLKGSPFEKFLSQTFGGKLCNEIRTVDPQYPYVSETEEEFKTITLEIKGKSTLEEAFEGFVKGEKLEGDNAFSCDKYGRKVDAERSTCLKSIDNTLIVHLKRFEFDFATYKKAKLNDRCEFPLTLNVKPWTKEGLALREGRVPDPKDCHPDSYYQFELMGVLVHSGSADAGHYYSYIKERVPNAKGERNWYEFNDHKTSPFDPKDLAVECFGGNQMVTHWDPYQRSSVRKEYEKVRSGYMLFYERVQPEELRVPISPPGESPQCFPLPNDPHFVEKVTNVANELTKRRNGLPFMRGIPLPIYNQVWKENAEYLRAQHLSHPSYFEFFLNFCRIAHFPAVTLYAAPDPADPAFRTIELATLFALQNVARARDSENLFHNWILQLKTMYSTHIPACRWFLTHCMQFGLIKELSLENNNEKIRVGFVELVLHVLRTLAPLEYEFWNEVEEPNNNNKGVNGQPGSPPSSSAEPGTSPVTSPNQNNMEVSASVPPNSPNNNNPTGTGSGGNNNNTGSGSNSNNNNGPPGYKTPKAICVRFMDAVLGLLEESRTFWRKFKQYFLIIRDFALIGSLPRQYLLQRGLITLYSDWFMGKAKRGHTRRVSVMDSFNLPDLVEFISAVAVLVRGCETAAPREMGHPPTTLEGTVLVMPPRERKELWDHTFFSSMLEMDYNTDAAIEVVVHSCWEDLKKSKHILEMVMSEIAKQYTSEKLPIFARILLAILNIEDSFQNTRIISALTPFSPPHSGSGVIRGLLSIIHDNAQAQHSRYGIHLVRLLINVAQTIPAAKKYVLNQKRELMWVESYLESRLSMESHGSGSSYTNHHPLLSDNEDEMEETFIGPRRPHELVVVGNGVGGSHSNNNNNTGSSGNNNNTTGNSAQKATVANLLAAVRELLAEAGGQEPNFDREKELMETIDSLKRENAKLKDALNYFREKSPEVKPPDFMLAPEWQKGAPLRIEEEELDDKNMKVEDEAPHMLMIQPAASQQEADLEAKAGMLREMFPNASIEVLKYALKRYDFDADTTVMFLMEEENMATLTSEVEERQRQAAKNSAASSNTSTSAPSNGGGNNSSSNNSSSSNQQGGGEVGGSGNTDGGSNKRPRTGAEPPPLPPKGTMG